MKSLSFEKQPEFLKWYTFEAMSGYKKFKIEKGKARVVSISGTTPSYGTEVTFESQKANPISALFG